MIDLSFVKNKKVAVLGLARSGLATCAALKNSGVNYNAWDDNEGARKQAINDGMNVVQTLNEFLDNVDLIVLSPSIPHNFPEPNPIVSEAKRRKIPLCSDMQLFRDAMPKMDVIGITGTNGKSTTTTLLGHVLDSRLDAQIGGNIGIPVLSLKDNKDVSVLELSSYQLELTENLNARGVIWLNISPDHIDRHGSLDGYVQAKMRIFERDSGRGVAFIGVDDQYSLGVSEKIQNCSDWNVVQVSVSQRLNNGISVVDSALYLDGEKQLDVSNLPTLKGVHNHQNVACVYGIARLIYQMDNDQILNALMSFEGLAHRQFLVWESNDIVFINDSKATNFEATAKALSSFENIFLIAGGQAKEGGISGIEDFRNKIKKVYLIGEAENNFSDFLARHNFENVTCRTLEKAITEAYHDAKQVKKESTILLSPACASWDQYSSFEERGKHFEDLVFKLI